MTDEERAREIGRSWLGDSGRDELLARDILQAFTAIRADEREKCAKVAEVAAGDQGDGAINYHRLGAMDAAAAIRARGSE